MADENNAESTVHIVYGTQSGNTMMLAAEAQEQIEALGLKTSVQDAADFDKDSLPAIDTFLLLISTYGDDEGAPPMMAEDLYDYIMSDEVPDLSNLSYSVLALGDSAYTFFCKAGIDFDNALAKHGAKRLVGRVDCDADYQEGFDQWIGFVLKALKTA